MITLIEQTKAHVIAFEIINGYTRDDEHSLEKLFEQRLDLGIQKVNMLIKISELHLMKSSFKAIWQDGIYALKHLKYCGRIAVVGDSKLEEVLSKADNMFFGNKKEGREERFFYEHHIAEALDWVNG